MASNSDLKRIFAFVWNTVIPPGGERLKSPVFSLMDAKWYLTFEYSSCSQQFSFGGNPGNNYKYEIRLNQESEGTKSEKPLRVAVFVSSDDRCFSPPSCSKRAANETVWVFYATRTDFKNISMNAQIFCAFHDVPQTTLSANLESLSNDFSKLLEVETFSDASVRCGDLTVPVHRNVMSARSEVFAAMFRNKMAESETGSVDVRDMDPQVLRMLLTYIYSGKVADVADDNLPRLYAAGDRYAVLALKKACSDRLVKCLTEENCVGVLTLADDHSDVAFKNKVISFICRHENVLEGEVWKTFCNEHSRLAVEVYQNYVPFKKSRSRET